LLRGRKTNLSLKSLLFHPPFDFKPCLDDSQARALRSRWRSGIGSYKPNTVWRWNTGAVLIVLWSTPSLPPCNVRDSGDLIRCSDGLCCPPFVIVEVMSHCSVSMKRMMYVYSSVDWLLDTVFRSYHPESI